MSSGEAVEVWRELRSLVIDGLDGYRHQVAEITGLPFSRIRAVRRLGRHGALTHAGLAEAMMVDRPAATLVVDELCERGLAVREAHPTDRRCKLVTLTPSGQRMAATIESVVPPPPQGWDELGPEELATLSRAVRRLSRRRD